MILQREREIRADGYFQPIEELRSSKGMVRVLNSIQEFCLFIIKYDTLQRLDKSLK